MHDREVALDARGQALVPAGGVAGLELARQGAARERVHEVGHHGQRDGRDKDGEDGGRRFLEIVQVDCLRGDQGSGCGGGDLLNEGFTERGIS